MSERLQALMEQIRALPRAERMELLNEMLDTLNTPEEVEAAWAVEIRRRVEELRSGKAELYDWEEARTWLHRPRQ